MAHPFSYKPLTSPATIRVLDLLPAKSYSADIEINLRDLPFILPDPASGNATLEYEALSYVWGAKTGDRPITCNGGQLFITANCELALRHLRSDSTQRTLWIDAICINQSSDDEKSAQVGMMGYIYHFAARTIVWLGAADSTTSDAFRYLQQLARKQTEVDREAKRWEAKHNQGDNSREMTHHTTASSLSAIFDSPYLEQPGGIRTEDIDGKGDITDEEASTFLSLINCPYFERVWTIQEVAMSSNAVVTRGESTIPWVDFARGFKPIIERLRERGTLPALGTIRFYEYWTCWLVMDVPDLKHVQEVFGRLTPIQWLLNTCYSHQASDPRDKIFALHHMFRKLDIHLPEPDYTKSLASVYTQATRAIIAQTASLAIFNVIPDGGSANALTMLPSWVLDFHEENHQRSPGSGKATRASSVNVHILSEQPESKLCLEGLKFGVIDQQVRMTCTSAEDKVLSERSQIEYVSGRMSGLRTCTEMVHRLMPRPYPRTEESVLEAFFHTLTAKLFEIPFTPSEMKQAYDTWTEVFRAATTEPPTDADIQRWVPPDLRSGSLTRDPDAMLLITILKQQREISGGAEKIGKMLLFYQLLEDTHRDKRFFVTGDGYFGIGPSGLRKDDLVVLLAGATSPIILRPAADSYQYVGMAIVQGIMNGEAWTDSDTQSLEKFVLA